MALSAFAVLRKGSRPLTSREVVAVHLEAKEPVPDADTLNDITSRLYRAMRLECEARRVRSLGSVPILWESAAQGRVPQLDQAADQLSDVGDFEMRPAGPVVPTIYRTEAMRLSLIATIAQFGTPDNLRWMI